MKARNDEVEQQADELREHYYFDYSKAKPNRFADRLSEETLVVVLDPDVAAVFTTWENDLPPELQGELVSLQSQSDKALLTVAQESVPSEQWRRHEYLLSRNQEGSLTAAERAELTRLRTAVDRLVLRRSYALALLSGEGTPSLRT